jgi:hypothetical protein
LTLDSKTCDRIVIFSGMSFSCQKPENQWLLSLFSIRFLIDEAIRRRPEFFVQTQTPAFAAAIGT